MPRSASAIKNNSSRRATNAGKMQRLFLWEYFYFVAFARSTFSITSSHDLKNYSNYVSANESVLILKNSIVLHEPILINVQTSLEVEGGGHSFDCAKAPISIRSLSNNSNITFNSVMFLNCWDMNFDSLHQLSLISSILHNSTGIDYCNQFCSSISFKGPSL